MKSKTAAILTRLYSIFLLTMVFAAPSSSFAQDITTGLVAHYKLDETSGSTVYDALGTSDGTFTGGQTANTLTVNGKVRTALSFDSTSDYIEVTNESTFDFASSFSIAFGMKNDGYNYQYETVLIKAGAFQIERNVSGTGLQFYINGIANGNGYDGKLDDGTWHHVAVVYDASNTDSFVYIDGFLASTQPSATGTPVTSNDNLAIGENPFTGFREWTGELDDIRFYNRILTPGDVRELYQSATGSVRYQQETQGVEYFNSDEWVHAGLGSYRPNAVNIDNTSGLLNTTSTGPTNSTKWTGSFWVKRDELSVVKVIYDKRIDPGDTYRVDIDFDSGSDSIRFLAQNSSSTTVLHVLSDPIDDNEWHHVLFSFDLKNAANRHVYIDDVSSILSVPTYNTAETMDFSATEEAVGQGANGCCNLNGSLADLWLDFDTYVDLSVEANRRKFISSNGMPMYLGPDGSLPLGKKPDIFLSGNTEDWHINKGSGGGFTENGAITDAAGKPFVNTWRSATQSSVKITASDGVADDNLGGYSPFGAVNSADVDGMYTVVGAPGAEAVYVFNTETGAQLHKISNPGGGSNFGYGVAVEGSTMVVGAPGNCGANLYIYDLKSDPASPQTSIQGLGSCQGWDVDISGEKFIVGTRISTNAYVADITTGSVLYTLSPAVANGGATYGVAIDGDWAIVGNPGYNSNEGRAYLYNLSACGGSCTETYELIASDIAAGDSFGYDVGIDGNYAVVGSPGGNAAYVFDVSTGTELYILTPGTADVSNGNFGADIDVKNNLAIVGHNRGYTGSRYGAAELFDVSTGTSVYEFLNPELDADDQFGASTAIDSDRVVIGVPGDDDSASGAGAVYIYSNKPCQNPDGRTGDIIYNTAFNVMQYCNGVDWVAMGPVDGTTGSGCYNPSGSAGNIQYNQDYELLQYCNSNDWIGVGLNTNDNAPGLASLLGNWLLDETSGSTAFDSSGNGYDGAYLNTPTPTTQSVKGWALDLDEADRDGVEITGTDFGTPDDVTIAGWINVDSFDTSGSTLFNALQRVRLEVFPTYIEGSFESTGSTQNRTQFTTTIADGNWHHMAYTYDDAGNEQNLYLDGILVATDTYTESIDWASGTTSRIGRHVNDSADFDLDGRIDDVRIYGAALSDAQIFDIYKDGGGFNINDDMVAHWKLDETSGATIADSSGTGNDGTWTDSVNNDVAEESVSGISGTALSFDGTDDIINIGDVTQINGIPQMTMAGWLRRDAANDFAHFGDDNATGTGNTIGFWSDGNLYFMVSNGSYDYGVYALNDTDWHHAVLVYDGTQSGNAARLRGFVDGVEVPLSYNSTIPATTYATPGLNFRIGEYRNGDYTNGTIDDVRIYDKPLTPGEVKILYEATR